MTAERKPTSAEEIFPLLIEQAADHAVILLDAQGGITAWLAGSEKLLGYTAEEMVGGHISRLFTPEDLQKGVPEYELEVATENRFAEDDRWMLRKDGLRIWATGATIPLRNQRNDLVGFAKILRNRTDLKSRMESMESEIRSLRESEAKKNDFISTLAHELRNPLSATLAAIELLRMEGPAADGETPAVSTIERQIQNMRRLVDDLLETTRVSRGKVRLDKRSVCLREVIEHAVESCKPIIDQRSHNLRVILAHGSVLVNADPPRLEQVFVNLIENAVKYTEYGGSIWVKLSVEGKEAVVKVEDTGIGISAELLPRIFDLFTQSEFASTQANGLGIGLSVVKNLIALHGGTVQVRSDGIGKGSEFTVRLPLAGEDQHRPDRPGVQ